LKDFEIGEGASTVIQRSLEARKNPVQLWASPPYFLFCTDVAKLEDALAHTPVAA